MDTTKTKVFVSPTYIRELKSLLDRRQKYLNELQKIKELKEKQELAIQKVNKILKKIYFYLGYPNEDPRLYPSSVLDTAKLEQREKEIENKLISIEGDIIEVEKKIAKDILEQLLKR